MGLVQKAFSDIITFSRSSNATRVGPTGRVEYAPHNLLVRSQEFDNASWTKANITVTANSVAAPDGTVTADSFTESTDGGVTSHFIYQGATLAAGAVYTYSIYAKASATNRLLTLYATDSASSVFVNVSFNLNTGVVAFTGSGAGTITSVGNGWYRCTVTGTATAAGSGLIWLWSKNLSGVDYTGNGSLVAYIWGAQLSVGPYALDYTPTTSAAVYGPRFDYDPVTLAARGLLVEESRTNLSTYSEDFSNAAWVSYSASKTATFAAAPNGTITANRISENASNTLQAIYNTISTSTTGARTVSVFAKAAERSFFRVSLSGAGTTEWFGATFDLQNGTVTQQNAGAAGTVSGATITAFGSGWYRCTVTGDTGSTGVTYAYIGPALTGTPSAGSFGVLTYSGNSSNGVLAWGAQLEAGSFATSYIPTLASTVTRSADVASVNTLSPWYSSSESTLFADFDISGPSGAFGGYVAQLAVTALSNNGILIYNNSVGLGTSAYVDASSVSLGNNTANVPAKIAIAYNGSSNGAVRNGGSVSSVGTTVSGAATRLSLGSEYGGNYVMNGHLRRVAYYPRRLTNAEIQALTS